MNRSESQYQFLIAVLSSILLWSSIIRLGAPFVTGGGGLGYASGWAWALWISVLMFAGFLVSQIKEYLETLRRSDEAVRVEINGWAKISFVFGCLMTSIGMAGAIGLSLVDSGHDSAVFVLLVVGFSGFSVIDYGRKLRAATREGSGGVLNKLTERLHASGVGPTADAVMAKDRRRPVLYLRSFDDEAHRASVVGRYARYWFGLSGSAEGFYMISSKRIEAKLLLGPYRQRSMRRSLVQSSRSMFDEQLVFAEYMDLIGPYIAIGRPNEVFSNMDLGAAKKYVEDADWQRVVLQWLEDSAAVVLDVGTSEGFLWEIKQVVGLANPKKILLILPWQQKHYDLFIKATARMFPMPLPPIRPSSRLLTFRSNWEPFVLTRPSDDISLEGVLRPFVQQNGLVLKRVQ